MNVSNSAVPEEQLAELFRLLAQPTRLQILQVIGEGEACVCHLEAALGLRQAYISQQLMLLRDAGLVTTNRDGRNIYYRLENTGVLGVITQAVQVLGLSQDDDRRFHSDPIANCPCPHCTGSANPF